jgi:hypothetical protein
MLAQFSPNTPGFFVDGRLHNGLTYAEYLTAVENLARTPSEEPADDLTRNRVRNAGLNLQRMQRITRTYIPGEPLRLALARVTRPQLWMVLSEPWCGDSAQVLPYLQKMVEISPAITMRMLLRDENPDIMDNYLTDGTRGIPKVVAFDAQGEELFRWGPRPAEGQAVFRRAREEGKTKKEALEALHLWYGRNRGQAIEAEFLLLLTRDD